MDLGYENPKIRGKRDGKERRNYYKDLFIDDYLSKKFILAFLGAKIPINGYEYKIFYKKLSEELYEIYNRNIDGSDKKSYREDIDKNIKNMYKSSISSVHK